VRGKSHGLALAGRNPDKQQHAGATTAAADGTLHIGDPCDPAKDGAPPPDEACGAVLAAFGIAHASCATLRQRRIPSGLSAKVGEDEACSSRSKRTGGNRWDIGARVHGAPGASNYG
jgi:hypothetical protein